MLFPVRVIDLLPAVPTSALVDRGKLHCMLPALVLGLRRAKDEVCRLPPPPSASRLDRQKRRRGAAYVFPMPLALDQPLLPVSCGWHVP